MNENWLPIPGHAGYEVSDLGKVRSWKVYGQPPPRLLATRIEDGYERVQLSRVSCRVHQLVLLAFVGPRPDICRTATKRQNYLRRVAKLAAVDAANGDAS